MKSGPAPGSQLSGSYLNHKTKPVQTAPCTPPVISVWHTHCVPGRPCLLEPHERGLALMLPPERGSAGSCLHEFEDSTQI